MSINVDQIPIGIDRRTLRTRHLLAEALMSLGADRDIDTLDVGEIISEAGVARSTFYAHFASKDDFLVRSYVNMIAMTEAAYAAKYPDRTDLLPSRALFTHVYQAGDFARNIVHAAAYPRQMAAGEAKLRDIVEGNLARLKPDWPLERRRETAVYVAGGFIGLMRWWKESGLRQTPERMQAAFEHLTRNALGAD